MKNARPLCHALAWLAAAGACLPASSAIGIEAKSARGATQPHAQDRPLIRDIALREGGLLVGQAFDEALQPLPGAKVIVQTGGQAAASATTDANGVFAVAGLRGGVHQIVSGGTLEHCRLWAPGAAPPRAANELRIVRGQDKVVRGQWGSPRHSYVDQTQQWLNDPWVIAGIVATAIAVPVVLHNNNDDDEDEGS